MSLILSLDTSSSGCSVAIQDDNKILAVSETLKQHSHGARLAVMISQVLENAGVRFSALSCVAIASGPGSYTGLRIGTSTAKGLCYALNIPLIAIDSLSAMAKGVVNQNNDDALYCPMLDARRMEVYCAVLNSNLDFIEPVQTKIIDETSFQDLLQNQKLLFFGDGSSKCREFIRHPNAGFIEGIMPSARTVGELAWEKFQAGTFEDLVHFEPLYLKEFLLKKSTKLDSLLNK